MDNHPTERFTTRVDNYVRYRPDYPAGIISLLQREIGLAANWTIADVGSGPGNLTRRFLDLGASVFGVEPNQAMREAGEVLMANDANFTSIAGTAEATTLPDVSVNLVTAGQAFHWFDPAPTRHEFRRILTVPGWVALIWNRRPERGSAIHEAHHEMLQQYSSEYDRVVVRDSSTQEGMAILFGDRGYREFVLPHEQQLDATAYWGRLLSSSYTPLPGEPGHDEIHQRSQEIFETYAQDGIVRFPYETEVFLGQVLAGD